MRLRLLAPCCALAAACALPGNADSLEWTVGAWHGTRRDTVDGSEVPMQVVVEPLADGAGQFERVEVGTGERPYVGFSVRQRMPAGGWVMLYGNVSRPGLARYEGDLSGGVLTMRSVTPGRTREGRLVSERTDADGWRRTQSMSTDGGRTWSVLFVDDLRRGARGEPARDTAK